MNYGSCSKMKPWWKSSVNKQSNVKDGPFYFSASGGLGHFFFQHKLVFILQDFFVLFIVGDIFSFFLPAIKKEKLHPLVPYSWYLSLKVIC